MAPRRNLTRSLSRRALLKFLGVTPLALRAAPLHGSGLGSGLIFGPPGLFPDRSLPSPDSPPRLTPHYPAPSPLEEVLHRVAPGADDYETEQYALEIESLLRLWSETLKTPGRNLSALSHTVDPSIQASPLTPSKEISVRAGYGVEVRKAQFDAPPAPGRERFFKEIQAWLAPAARVETAEFEVTSIAKAEDDPTRYRMDIRFGIVAERGDGRREERVGAWRTEWSRGAQANWTARRWEAREQTSALAAQPSFLDVTAQALGGVDSYRRQLLPGTDYWRTVLDGGCGIDVYGNNGVAAGDFDNDGFDDIYICQPAGLPNRLYRNRGDGGFEDVTDKAGVGVLDNTACALFADFENKGLQDLLVVCGGGPLLFLNRGDGTFRLKPDAFQFKTPPQGTFAHAAVADYDLDGRLDIYFCLYSYYLGLDQYHYPAPYFDARNGPPNFLMHNEGNAVFSDRTAASGLNAENDRYSFACAWGDCDSDGLPDLYVANDFGRSNLYRNRGDGTFSAVSSESHADTPGAGMSACWSDYNNDGRQDIYAANMWSAAGQRVSEQEQFHRDSPASIRALYRRHARGNSLYRNLGGGRFENVSAQAGAEMGRWSWCSDLWDFDHDGFPDLYVANGYISGPDRGDLASFFWRQVVAKSPDDATPSTPYERGWNALNELIRSDRTWSGYERNVLFANNRDGSFSEVSGAIGLDFLEDSRSFALADLDHDGRLEVILKNRSAPQLRILHNAMREIGDSICFRLRGVKSNRDAIGAAVTVTAGSLRQTKYLQAGSGFLAQHSKELFFGLGRPQSALQATIRWPSGLSQTLEELPANHRFTVEEGSSEHQAQPFAAPSPARTSLAPPTIPPLPEEVQTWLIEPLKAPEFTLPDAAGQPHELRSLRGRFALLNFWTAKAPLCAGQLRLLHRSSETLSANHLEILAINVDPVADLPAARAFAAQAGLSFPALFATEDVAGVYNIVYRYLYDRRRDLPIPSSFLLDREGMIVKVYQGAIDPRRLMEDVRTVPATAGERLKRALPFAGTVYQDAFQRNDFTYGVAMFQHGYLDQAEESFRQVVAAKPGDPEAYYNLGTLSLRRNDLNQASQYLAQALKLRPNYPEAWNNLGMIDAQQGRPAQAVQNFQQALLLRPGYATALLNLGNLYRRMQDFDKAQASLSRALAAQPDDPEINYSLGMMYAQQNQTGPAAQYLQRAVELRPDYPQALNNLGVLFAQGNNLAKAEEQFKTCIRLSPDFDQSYLNLARLYAMSGDRAKAREVLTELLRRQPGNPAAREAMGVLQ